MCKTGKKQSPIDIVTEDAIRMDLGALKFDRYDFAFTGALTNTGHSGKQMKISVHYTYSSGWEVLQLFNESFYSASSAWWCTDSPQRR